jgi:hypothetical protein
MKQNMRWIFDFVWLPARLWIEWKFKGDQNASELEEVGSGFQEVDPCSCSSFSLLSPSMLACSSSLVPSALSSWLPGGTVPGIIFLQLSQYHFTSSRSDSVILFQPQWGQRMMDSWGSDCGGSDCGNRNRSRVEWWSRGSIQDSGTREYLPENYRESREVRF